MMDGSQYDNLALRKKVEELMRQGEIYEKNRHELEDRIEDLEEENVALGEEVRQWMEDYDILKNTDTRLLMDILKELESGDYDVPSICAWIRDALKQ